MDRQGKEVWALRGMATDYTHHNVHPTYVRFCNSFPREGSSVVDLGSTSCMGCTRNLLPFSYWSSCGDIPDGFPRTHTNALRWSGCLSSQQHIVDCGFTAKAKKVLRRRGNGFRRPCEALVCCDEKDAAEYEGSAT